MARKNKRAYLDDFVLNDNGKYEYKGIIYKVKEKFESKYILIGSILICVLLIGAGFVPFEGSMHAFYIIFPYIAEIGLCALLMYAIIVFLYNIKELREYKYKKTYERFKPYMAILIGNYGLSFLATIFYSIFNEFDVWAVVYASIHILTFIVTRQLQKYISKIEFNKIDKKA